MYIGGMNGRTRSRSFTVRTSPGLKSGLALLLAVSHCSTLCRVASVSCAAAEVAKTAIKMSAETAARSRNRWDMPAVLRRAACPAPITNCSITEHSPFNRSDSDPSCDWTFEGVPVCRAGSAANPARFGAPRYSDARTCLFEPFEISKDWPDDAFPLISPAPRVQRNHRKLARVIGL